MQNQSRDQHDLDLASPKMGWVGRLSGMSAARVCSLFKLSFCERLEMCGYFDHLAATFQNIFQPLQLTKRIGNSQDSVTGRTGTR